MNSTVDVVIFLCIGLLSQNIIGMGASELASSLSIVDETVDLVIANSGHLKHLSAMELFVARPSAIIDMNAPPVRV